MASPTFQSAPAYLRWVHSPFLLLLLLLWTSAKTGAQLHDESFPAHPSDAENGKRLTREYRLKQGVIKGLVLEPREGKGLDGVEVFLGIPYAAAPVGGMRFMPPGSATQWSGLKLATTFAPVCPQTLPDLKKESFLSAGRYNYLKRLMPFLKNQSEDCLYLNVYVPSSEGYSPFGNHKKYPVLIFIHGESFEWNSGNPYDGTVLAAYGQIIVVTINFRLGILGFMKPSISDNSIGNFGLLDQVAALQWVKDNIGAFRGDPGAVTLAGHGTGAACANFLMVSPVANGLFHRAILMSGSALSDWALTANPLQFTVQAAQSLNCPLTADDLGECLRRKRLSEIMAVRVLAPRFMTPFGPIIDGSVVPNEPAQVMGVYKNLFKKYELIYGCTELESYHLLGAVALAHGMLESERDALLRLYSQARFEYRPDLALAATLKEYSSFDLEPGKSAADSQRDSLLDILSDARVTAPLVQTANFHSKANPRSYFYVFGHNSQAGEYAALSKSVHGEELAYVFGVPLGANGNHFREEYSPQEKLFSELIMTYWTNFARTGNPNNPRKSSFLSLGPKDWNKYDIEWPQYNPDNQSFVHLGIPPRISTRYRSRYMKYWNEVLPNMLKNHTSNPMTAYESPPLKNPKSTTRPFRFGAPPPWINPTVPKSRIFSGGEREPTPNHNENYGRFNQFQRPSHEVKVTHEDPYKELRKMERPVRPIAPGLMDGPLRNWRTQKENVPPILVAASNTEEITVINPTSETPVQIGKLSPAVIVIIAVAVPFIVAVVLSLIYWRRQKMRSILTQNKQVNVCSNGDLHDGDVNNCYEKDIGDDETKTGCNVFKIIKYSSDNNITDDFYEPVKNQALEGSKTPKSDDSGGFGQRFKLRRHMSNSTIDAQTKVRDWIAHEIVQRCSPRFLRKTEEPKPEQKHFSSNLVNIPYNSKSAIDEISKDIPKPNCKIGSLTGSLKAPTNSTTSVGALEKQLKTNTDKKKSSQGSKKNSRHTGSAKSSKPSVSTKSGKSHHSQEKNASDGSLKREKPMKVSVAIDATPATRSSSVLKQQPIEFSKSLDYCCYLDDSYPVSTSPLRRSQTVEDFIKRSSKEGLPTENVFKSTVNLKVSAKDTNPSEVIKITHKHSASDPVKDINYADMFPYRIGPKQPGSFHTFSTLQPPAAFRNDINVTSRDDHNGLKKTMTPEESLMNMKRRNYPKVLPDLPKSGDTVLTLAQKRLSLPPQNHLLLLPTFEEKSISNSEASTPTELKSFMRCPPLPPPRTSSTLGRKHSNIQEHPYEVMNAKRNMPANYCEMSSNTLPNSLRFNTNPSEIMQLYAQVKNKPKNRVNMMELEMSDVSQSDQTDSEREDENQYSSHEAIKPKPRVIVTANPGDPVRVMDPKVIIRPIINKNPNINKLTSIPRVIARDNSFDDVDIKTHANKTNPPTFPKDAVPVVSKISTADAKMGNPSRITDVKKHIPVYKPDSKGPPTAEELERQKIKQIQQDVEKNLKEANITPKSNNDVIITTENLTKPSCKEEIKKNTKVEKKASSVSRSNSASKIPKTPTMVAKNSKKEIKPQQSPKPNKAKPQTKAAPSKISSIPKPVPSQKSSIDSCENDQSTSESSNDTECSTGTVKKIK